jgi:hypothetical protein
MALKKAYCFNPKVFKKTFTQVTFYYQSNYIFVNLSILLVK